MDLNGRQRKVSRDGWMFERVLGSGGFGTVTLFENKITKEKIAIKQCRLELNIRNRQRWQQEVDIMKSLNHVNIVAARDVPISLDVPEGELPLLAMEFCSGGDLRKVLSSPENRCGLQEQTVLAIASDVGEAVEFLHSHRIIHRDLKPENVVISHEENKITYKLIDLGYAKQLDQGSLATTFVGTLKYLAPELLDKVQYTKTVDYWSFGTLLFECITGSRPFLPDVSPVQWHTEVGRKAPDDICAYFDVSGDIQFSKSLPVPNSLSGPLQEKFVKLLRLLLLWDPKERGGPENSNKKRQYYTDLQTIIGTKILHVFCVSLCTLHSFEVLPSCSIKDIQAKLCEWEPGLDKESQLEILTATGEVVRPEDLVQSMKSNAGEDLTVFLFQKKEVSKPTNLIRSLPQTIHMIITEPQTMMSYQELKKAFIQGLHFCREQAKSYRLMLEGFRAALICLLKLNSNMGQLKNQMLVNVHKIETKQEFFRTSYETDLRHYRAVADFVDGDSFLQGWGEAEKQASASHDYGTAELKKECNVAQAEVLALQKSPFGNSGQFKTNQDDMYERAVKLYQELRQNDRPDRKQAMGDCSKMTAILLECLRFREKAHQAILSDLNRVLRCKQEILAVIPKLKSATAVITERSNLIGQMQRQRQDQVWKLLKSKLTTDNSSNSVVSQMDYSTVADQLPSLSTNPSNTGSLVLLEESCTSGPGISEIVCSLKSEQEKVQDLDWSFLSEDDDEPEA